MKTLLAALFLCASLSQATIIQWSGSNDQKRNGSADLVANDGIYTGQVMDVVYQNGDLNFSDALIGKFTLININTNKFYISTSKSPLIPLANILFTGDFATDITASNIDQNYTLGNIVINNTIGSQALTEFASVVSQYPTGAYTFSIIQDSKGNKIGSGEVATVPEPTTLGLFGLGLLSLGAVAFRRRKA